MSQHLPAVIDLARGQAAMGKPRGQTRLVRLVEQVELAIRGCLPVTLDPNDVSRRLPIRHLTLQRRLPAA